MNQLNMAGQKAEVGEKQGEKRYRDNSLMLRLYLWYLYKIFGRSKFRINKFDLDRCVANDENS